ncbi:putative sporulation-specific N-formyltyrosine oxidase Dit2 [Zopfia rhizophila CBS 207.26]|uniref:Putative sporulation-specific N-formyltyrosine oxidase Dit2 n=1 Tax=Zopfia rhizophila CBS 207.26 TaxID=1314779 RepID=A0A6A6EXH0_9PEZI|nr:putative sporulation-specific N-formyltyrosine oxidase Dit2 [Zopfia rhizophila CBS 207.26]
MAILTGLYLWCALVGTLIWYYIHVPWNFPRQLPRIPLYVSLLGLWSNMGQDEIYERWLRRPLEKHGAVVIWFAGRWNVLVTRPHYLTDMFRNEDVYAKAGSQVKIPWSVIASLVGDNIINSHGTTWRLYTGIMKPGMQKREFDTKPMLRKSRRLVDLFIEKQNAVAEDEETGIEDGVFVNGLVQKWAIDVMGESFLDYDFQCLEKPHVRVEELQTIIKKTLFKPLYFNFPTLDKYPYVFTSRRRAFAIMKEFEDLLYHTVRTNPRKYEQENRELQDKQVVHMLEEALDSGKINDKQFRSNIKIMFLTAHENVQQLVNSTFWELGKNQDVQNRLRQEILDTQTDTPTAELVNGMPYLTSTIFELLRLYPPVSQLINRVTLQPTVLGGDICIPAHTWVGWNAYGVHINRDVWGPTAQEFRPERWGTKPEENQAKFRRETVRGAYIPFNAHTRKCLGQGFALLEMKVMLFELLRRVKWNIHPDYHLKLTSGGILAPLGCKVVFQEVSDDAELN